MNTCAIRTFFKTAVATLALLLASSPGLAQTEPITWIDVRTPAEYAEGHVPGAINIPHEVIAAEIGSLDLVKSQPIYLYCGSGRRAGIAKESLEAQGYSQVKNLGGLQDALKEAGAEPAR